MRKGFLKKCLAAFLSITLLLGNVLYAEIQVTASEMHTSSNENMQDAEDDSLENEESGETGDSEIEAGYEDDTEIETEENPKPEQSETEQEKEHSEENSGDDSTTKDETESEMEDETESSDEAIMEEDTIVEELSETDETETGAEVNTINSLEADIGKKSGNIASGVYGDTSWVIDADGKLTVEGTGEIRHYNDGHTEWYGYRNSITCAEIKTKNMKNASNLFESCGNLVSVDLSNFDTSNVDNMSGMFYGCNNLKDIDLSGFNTSNVTDMSYMFHGCSSLADIDLGIFDTKNVIDMSDMFRNCRSLTNIDLSNFDTGNVTNMSYMFEGCNGLVNINLRGWDTGNVTDMSNMFMDCEKLTSLDISEFNTQNVKDMTWMLSNCKSLESINLDNLDTRNVEKMSCMFDGCSKVTDLNLSNFDTSQVIDITGMFINCESLRCLDLSSFDLKNTTNKLFYSTAKSIMEYCYSLDTIYTPYNVNISLELPAYNDDVWYRSDGTEVTELPQNLDHSIVLGKNYVPEEKEDESGEEIGGETSDEVELLSNMTVSQDKSILKIVDKETGKSIAQARVLTDSEHMTNKNGIVELDNNGITTIQIEKEGYIKKDTEINLEKGKVKVIYLNPDKGNVGIIAASIQLNGEKRNIIDDIVYLKSRNMEDWEGNKTTFKLTLKSSGYPKRYQLIQDSKVIEENGSGVFDLPGRYINNSDGSVSYYVDGFSSGHRVFARVYDEHNKYKTQELGIRVSEESSVIMKIKDGNGKDFVDFGNMATAITIPDNIPIVGGSKMKFGFTEKIPIAVSADNSGKVKIAINMGDFDTSDSAKWWDKNQEYKNLAKRAEALQNSASVFGGTPSPFGAGMFSTNGSIVGYGEGYIDDSSDRLCINAGVVISVGGEAKYTQYCFVTFIPVYITFGGGIDGTFTEKVSISFGNGFSVNGGSMETEFSPYAKLESGVGADGILSIGAYGKFTFNWLHRFTNDYDRITASANAKIKATAFMWSKVLAEADFFNKVIYDDNQKSASYSARTGAYSLKALNMSGSEVISKEYLSKRKESSSVSVYARTGASDISSQTFLNYAYENADPRLIKAGNKIYMFYLDGVEKREEQNQSALFFQYSTDNGKTWSKATRVDNGANETADYDFDVAVSGNNIYAIWSDAGKIYGNEIVSMDAVEGITQIGKEMNLMMAEINTANNKITTRKISTSNADLQPQIAVGNDGTVYTAWIANDISADEGLFSNENKINICYASSADNYSVHTTSLPSGTYPLKIDVGIMGSDVYAVIDVDEDNNMSTQEDREIYDINLAAGGSLYTLTSDKITDSSPTFAKLSGNNCLFWNQDGNIVYTMDGQNVSLVFGKDNLPAIGQDFSVLEADNGNASIVWTATSQTKDVGVDIYCTDYDGSKWSGSYRLDELNSEYTTSVNGYFDGNSHRLAYLGSFYDGDKLYSHIYLCTPDKRTDTSIIAFAEKEGAPGEEYPMHVTVVNNGNVSVSSIEISSSDGDINDVINGLSIAPGASYDFTWNGIVVPSEMTEIYKCSFTIKADGETDIDNNVFDVNVGEPDFSIETYLDYSEGEQLAGAIVTNDGILASNAVLTIYQDAKHTKQLYKSALSDISGGESKLAIFDLTALSEKTPVFYFVVSDDNGMETYTENNESILYSGKGTYLEDDKPDSGSSETDEPEKDEPGKDDADGNDGEWHTSDSVDMSEGIEAGADIEIWKPTTPDEKKRYACVGDEAVQYTLSADNSYRLIIEKAMQGPLCFNSFEAVLADYTIGRTYNIYPYPDKIYSMDKEAQFTIKIPKAIYKEGREYKMICVTKLGLPIVYEDLDKNPETITVKTNRFYAYALIYKDIEQH